MVNTPQEYYSLLSAIQNKNFPMITPPQIALLSEREVIYDIDLHARKINSPRFIGVEKDHAAETIYFRVDRYYDYADLKDTVCIIQYTNANNETRLYPVPFYDISTYSEEQKMLIPWNVGAGATITPGTVTYSLKFYRLDPNGNFEYNLNTQPALTTVLRGMNAENFDENYILSANQYETLLSKIETIDRQDLYWVDLYSY